MQILLMSDMAEFDDLRLELQKLKKKKQSTDVLGKVGHTKLQLRSAQVEIHRKQQREMGIARMNDGLCRLVPLCGVQEVFSAKK